MCGEVHAYHVCIPTGQALAGEINGKQAARAGRIQIAAGAFEVEEPTQAVRKH
jgi:hypothetical protein